MRAAFFGCLVAFLTTSPLTASDRSLPRFTEEREAAALCFVKKHLPELTPLLTRLKKSHPGQYQHEMREIFQISEMLADLMEDDPRRHDLELKIWKTANRAHVLLGRLATLPVEEDRKPLLDQLQVLARELVELDVQVLEVQVEQLSKELTAAKEELDRLRETTDQQTRARVDALLDKIKRPRK